MQKKLLLQKYTSARDPQASSHLTSAFASPSKLNIVSIVLTHSLHLVQCSTLTVTLTLTQRSSVNKASVLCGWRAFKCKASLLSILMDIILWHDHFLPSSDMHQRHFINYKNVNRSVKLMFIG